MERGRKGQERELGLVTQNHGPVEKDLMGPQGP